jgi:hypothetical protein
MGPSAASGPASAQPGDFANGIRVILDSKAPAGRACGTSGRAAGERSRREPEGLVRLIEPVSLLSLSLKDVLLGFREAEQGRVRRAPGGAAPAAAEQGASAADAGRRIERGPLLGSFWHLGRTGGLIPVSL